MSGGNPYDYCPECGSQNVERTGMIIDGVPVPVVQCYHCDGVFRKMHILKETKKYPGYETTEVRWVKIQPPP